MENRPQQQEPPRRPSPPPARKPNGAGGPPTPPWLWVILLGGFAFIFWQFIPKPETSVVYNPWFLDQVDQDNIKSVSLMGTEVRGELREAREYQPSPTSTTAVEVRKFITYFPSEDSIQPVVEKLRKGGKTPAERVRIEPSPANQATGVVWLMLLLPTFLILGFIYLMMRRARDQFDGGILGSFVKSPAKRHDKSKQRTTFEEVAGLENAKAELQEIVEFLKNPEKFQRLGGRIPKGVLLVGPPGTGKTLLGRAVAGEAGVPFYSISGSEFIQMFVGVGASRVRDMFKTAKENSPCILFIDEIDAVGRVRGAGLGGGHDEREQTLNQILTEMDGFSPSESVIVLAATNRPDVLDPALLRPGRFDRHVTVDLPTKKGRLEILKVHARNVPLAEDVDLERIARNTVGMSGADLANLVNEAALLATREDKAAVDDKDLEAALDKVILGAKREEVITDRDKRATAYHEVGHALVGWLTPRSDPVHKVTIIPRGRSLGVTQFLPEEDRVSYNESQIKARIYTMMGGRAAERLVYDDLSTGAAQDLDQATRLVRKMVSQWGMSERVGPVSFRSSSENPFLGREMSEPRDHSEHMQQIIDEEVARILREAEEHAYGLLEQHRDELERLTEALIEKEVLTEAEITQLIGKRSGHVEPEAAKAPEGDEVVASLDNPS
ncbi:ATP-dependent zinc metalloprotease FtsH [Planctomyces sp. SH-PL62]|uniref:ATP-dependent zinc metalloprotease FtsH n=1 Tax=Planctomyces sp. SH-PL62 TaxID=1636152 RepID=UPI00078C4719|nr:ATP-dependent zinc metalloprotease FtsH [Planctomyces sp. SH-PL62]AMV37268.1 ATP-dependent zinc metalloprotease FtsH [Planctomyces sp. SH-PL62]